MADTVNERLLHEAIQHALALQRYGNGAVRKALTILNQAAGNVAAQLSAALTRLPPESFTVERLDLALESIKALNTEAYRRLADQLAGEARQLVDYELNYQHQLFTSVIPPQVLVELPLARINPEQVYAAAMARPFQGRLLREWAASQDALSMQRIRDTVRTGYVEQATISDIVQRVRGTRAKGFEDGILAIDRRQAEVIVRTAVSHTAGFARDEFLSENEDLVKEVQWVSTLDAKTSEPCILRDGKRYGNEDHAPIGHTYPWGAGPGRFHWCCRSTSTPIVKSFRELGLDLDEFSVETRASMDGQVAADLSYGEWLAKQSAERQDDVLGATRGALFRRGGLDIAKFANDKGRWLSLDELAAKDAAAFAKAGV